MGTPSIGRGTVLAYGAQGSSPTYTAIASVESVDGPNITIGEVETTVLSSTFKSYLPTIPEGELTFNLRMVSTDPAVIAFRSALKAAPIPSYSWKLTYPDGSFELFDGFPKGFTVSGVANEDVIMAAIPLRLTSAPIFNPAPAGGNS